jgi:hypothetical protein
MPPPDPAGQADHHEAEPGRTAQRPVRDRHGRQDATDRTMRTDLRYAVGPPKTVSMTPDEYARAVHAWAVLIAAWWTDNPPEEDDE